MREGRPSVRMVLLKAWGEEGFVFHTNYDSRKGRELADNPHAALLFYWEPMGRQVRIEGPAGAHRRPRSPTPTSPPGPAAARSAPTPRTRAGPSRTGTGLDARVEALQAEYAGREVPRPAWWGGLRVAPRVFEFWQNRDDRLHDRLRYAPRAGRVGGSTRLQP